MKEALTRLLAYFAIAVILIAMFNAWPNPLYQIWPYLVATAPITLVGEAIVLVRNILYNRRLKLENQPTTELPVPDTQPLERK